MHVDRDQRVGRRARIRGTGLLLLGLCAAEAAGQRQAVGRGTGSSTVTVVLDSPQGGRTVDPGETVEWRLHAFVDQASEGLALFLFDLSQAPGNPERFDLPAADGVPAGMTSFDRPAGFTNSGQGFTGSGFAGIQVGESGARDLIQIGGAQNVFGVPGPCFGPGTNVCLGQATQVEVGVGQSAGGQRIAEGSFVAPSTHGTYVFEVSSILALTITEARTPPEPTPVARAAIVPGSVRFSVNVAPTSHHVDPTGTTPLRPERSSPPLEAPSNAEIVAPAEGEVLTQIHTRFRWPAIAGIQGDYVLELVEDDGSGDPFVGGFPVTSLVSGGSEPRALVTQGLEFGRPHAWRVYEQGSAPGSEVHRFETAPLPAEVPAIEVTNGACPLEPGVTVFGLRGVLTNHKGLVVTVDGDGEVVHFLESQADRVNDVRQIHTGQLLLGKFPDTPNGTKGRAVVVTTRGGKTVWASPDTLNMEGGDLYSTHHEAAVGPDGDYLLLVREAQDHTIMGVTERWRGDRIVLLDRQTSDMVWSWNTFDHYSLQDEGIDWNTGMPYGPEDWTHGNGAIWHPSDGDVYYSARNLSRVTRIDFATGAPVYDMGMDMPSGDTEFGDGLFTNQHAPQMLANGNLVLFDNGNLNVPLPLESSAREIAFDDPDDPTSASVVWEYCALDRDGMTPLFTPLFGDADRLPGGNTLVTFGSASIVDEVCLAGSLARRLDIGGVGMPEYFLYRADHVAELIRDTPGDVDQDEDVDLLDLAALMETPVLPGPLPFPARLLDLDGDGGLGPADLGLLLEEMTGPGRDYP